MTNDSLSELLIGTRNAGKILELQSLLSALPQLRLRGLTEFPAIADVEETGRTFTENAALKAREYAKQTGLWALADDSGLEVEALGGAPGVYSARYAGAGASDEDRIERLLDNLSQSGDAARRARFVCVIAISDPHGEIANLSTGICTGAIAHAPRGTNGFGYDPVFVPDGYEQTFGELSAKIKEQISHRARALEAARSFLIDSFRGHAADEPINT
jgi:XTP/dITP diphosphohydrolase